MKYYDSVGKKNHYLLSGECSEKGKVYFNDEVKERKEVTIINVWESKC